MYASARTSGHAHASFVIPTLLTNVATAMHEPVRNRLLSKLASSGYQRLLPDLEEVSLHENQVLYALGDVVSHVYFPNDAIVSLLIEVDNGRTVEVAMEGNEGVAGLAIHLGGLNSCNLSNVRHEGTAMRLPVSALTPVNDGQGDLADLLLRKYVHALLMQVAQSGVCNRFHSFDMRLARWLLMTHDRTGTPELNATQVSMATVLGVRRSTVTDAASRLLKQNIIDYRRGHIEILDQARLLDATCPCYATIKRQYDSFLD
jgi:CRP-like cAMP-binding protein